MCDLESLRSTFTGNEWCDIRAFLKTEQNAVVDLFIQQELSWFVGHFPEQPVLPGVVQTHWACEFAQHIFALKGLKKVSNLKFKTMVLPDTELTLKISFNQAKNVVAFSYQNDNETFSTGSLLFSV